jgi:hypothetical protein
VLRECPFKIREKDNTSVTLVFFNKQGVDGCLIDMTCPGMCNSSCRANRGVDDGGVDLQESMMLVVLVFLDGRHWSARI